MANRSRFRASPLISLLNIWKSASPPPLITTALVMNFIARKYRMIASMMPSSPPVILASGRVPLLIFISWKRNVGRRNKIGNALGMPGRPFRPRRRQQRSRISARDLCSSSQDRKDAPPSKEYFYMHTLHFYFLHYKKPRFSQDDFYAAQNATH